MVFISEVIALHATPKNTLDMLKVEIIRTTLRRYDFCLKTNSKRIPKITVSSIRTR
jgi:hypothetical protein